ncbi:Eefsec, partial [Acrasis kona]
DNYDTVQFTLVDCPGHASLIRTIIGGAQIIDMMILVIDAVKGVQTQTSECIIIGEIIAKKLVVVLNKIDLLPEKGRDERIEKIKNALTKNVFSKTKFTDPIIVPVCASPNQGKDVDEKVRSMQESSLTQLIQVFKNQIEPREVSTQNVTKSPFLFAVDHCFSIKGKGTVLTGTVLQGSVSLEQNVEIVNIHELKKIKSLQVFKKPVKQAVVGDRVGALVTQLDSSRFERGFVADPGYVKTIDTIIATFSRIRYYKRPIQTKTKLHITVGHSTVMGVIYLIKGSYPGTEFNHVDSIDSESSFDDVLVRIDLEVPVPCYESAKIIASKLDTDIHENTCRLAFYGQVVHMCNRGNLGDFKVYKNKQKTAKVERIVDDYNLIGNQLVKKKGASLDPYINKKVTINIDNEDQEQVGHGVIASSFGSAGKFKVRLSAPLTRQSDNLLIRINYKVDSWDKSRKWIM